MSKNGMSEPSRTERWADIPGYEGRYQVSTRGRVRSLRRSVTVDRNGIRGFATRDGRILSPHVDRRTGRAYVNLYDDDHVRHPYSISHLLQVFSKNIF